MTDICRNLGHARASYYRRAAPKVIDANAVKLRATVRHIHADVHATYGSRRMRVELNAQGFTVGRYKVRSLMRALQLKAKRPKQHRYPPRLVVLSHCAGFVLKTHSELGILKPAQ